jgi:lysophospholipase L1-like esterase
MRTTWAALAGALVLSALAGTANAAAWVSTWAAAPLPPSAAMGPFPATPSYSNQTIRQVVRISAGGNRVRVRFTNEYGTQPLAIGAARITTADVKGNEQAASAHTLTFAGKPSALIPAGAPLLSDPVDLRTEALATLSISIYLPENTGPCTCHQAGMQTAYVSEAGNFLGKEFPAKEKSLSRAFISGVEVEATTPTKVIAVLGDSISDGVGSSNDANHRWPDLLAERLVARDAHKSWGIANLGISGNRLLNDGAGQSALARFDRDILSLPGLSHVIVFLGVNDLGISYGNLPPGPFGEAFKKMQPAAKPSAEAMIAGYRQLIERAHAKGVKIFGATIAPYEGAMYYSAEGNDVREQINKWMRSSGAFDAVLDFDAAFRDPQKPTQMAIPLQTGDHLHGSDLGYETLAKSIDLSLFK